MTEWTRPQDVVFPEYRWELIDVLHDGDGPDTLAYAVGMWEGRFTFAVRRNGTSSKPHGIPSTNGRPTWFMLDEEMTWLVVHHFGWSRRWRKLREMHL